MKKLRIKVMKSQGIKKGLFILFIFFTGAGCEKIQDDVYSWEISPDNKNPIIHTLVEGIEFKFCLMNEQGNPATVFREGENFYFYFSFKNKRDEMLYFAPYFAFYNDNFCKVFDSNNNEVGKPFEFLGWAKMPSPFNPVDDPVVFKQPWHNVKDLKWSWLWGDFRNTGPKLLPGGKYYTKFTDSFQFDRSHDKSELNVGPLSFKINFIIK